jgi:hypothetical protein
VAELVDLLQTETPHLRYQVQNGTTVDRAGGRELEWTLIGESDDLAGAIPIALADRQRGYHRRIVQRTGDAGRIAWWMAPLS